MSIDSLSKNALLAGISSLLVIITAFSGFEIYYRYFSIKEKTLYCFQDRELGWSPIPGYQMTNHPQGAIKINSAGFRSPEIDPSLKSVLILGDSVAWGYLAPQEKTASSFLSEKIKASGYQVINLAVPGYGTAQEFLRLRNNFSSLPKADKAVLIIYTNDLEDTRTNVFQNNRKPYFTRKNGSLFLHPVSAWDLRFLLTQIIIFRKASLHLPILDQWLGRLSGDITLPLEEGRETFKALLLEMDAFLRNQNIEPLLILSPSREDLSNKTDSFLETESALRETGLSYTPFLDILLKTENPELLFADADHYSERGNRLLADFIGQNLFPSQGADV